MKAADTALGAWVLNYLVNAVWQIVLLFFAVTLVGRLTRSRGPAAQHRLWVGTLMAATVLPACRMPFRVSALELWRSLGQLLSFHPAALHASVKVAAGAGLTHGMLRLPAEMLSAILLLYAGSLLYFGGRLASGLSQTKKLRRQAMPLAVPDSAVAAWQRWCWVFGIRQAAIAMSTNIHGPITLGLWRPLLLLPARLLGDLQAEDLDAALAHECAHVRRSDFGKNIAHHLLALPIAFHPFTWFALRQLGETREMVCDEMAADAVAGRWRYAHSLLRLAAIFSRPGQVNTLHAIGFVGANDFERRLMSLTEKRHEQRGVRQRIQVALAAVVMLCVCSSALALRMNVFAAAQQAGEQTTNAPASVPAGVMAGNVLAKVNPVYPETAKEAKVSGSIVLHAIIGKDGAIQNLSVVSGPEELRASAIEAVRQWTYKPYLLNGNPIEVETTITVTYSLAA